MDGVRFGRWIGERRRARGWQSQRALLAAVAQRPHLSALGLSADFLARLEAGGLTHPFRGAVRSRVLALATFLCATPRELDLFLRNAELRDLTATEAELAASLRTELAARQSPGCCLLPPRPAPFVGRAAELDLLGDVLAGREQSCCLVHGLPGAGKSALVAEAAWRVAEDSHTRYRLFPDGLISLTCTGLAGMEGLGALLADLLMVLAGSPRTRSDPAADGVAATPRAEPALDPTHTLNQLRHQLAGKRLLLVLDDLDAGFPLRPLLDALPAASVSATTTPTRPVVLMTSRYAFPLPGGGSHVRLAPLPEDAALELLMALLGPSAVQPISDESRDHARRLCHALGGLPLALEYAAGAITEAGVPLALLAARLEEYPLDPLLDAEGRLRSLLTAALAAAGPAARDRLSLLAGAGMEEFGLASASAITQPASLPAAPEAPIVSTDAALALPASLETLAEEAAAPSPTPAAVSGDLAQLVRYSLISLARSGTTPYGAEGGEEPRYQLHPLLRACAAEQCALLPPERIQAAREAALGYAEQVLAQAAEVTELEAERDFLLATLARTWYEERYGVVARLAYGLSHAVGRCGPDPAGERALLWGVRASQLSGDRYIMARLMNRLARLRFHRGALAEAQTIWYECLDVAASVARRGHAELWVPLTSLALLAVEAGDLEAARGHIESYLQHGLDSGELAPIISGLAKRAWHARLRGDFNAAAADTELGVRLCALRSTATQNGHDRMLALETQLEDARLRQDYREACRATEAMVATIRASCDHYNIADVLYEQAIYAHDGHHEEDAQALALRVVDVATHAGAERLIARGQALLQRLAVYSRARRRHA